MWSLGVLLFTILTGHYPFSAQKLSSTTGTSYVRSLLMVRIHLVFIFDLLRGVLLIVIVRLPLTSEVHVFSWPQGGQPRDLQPCVALGISKQCMDLLTRLLQQNPKARCRMKDVLKHPWFLCDLPPGATSTNKVCLEAT